MTMRLAEAGITARLATLPGVDEQAERRRARDRERKRMIRGMSADNEDNAEFPQNDDEEVSPKKGLPRTPSKKLPLPEKQKPAPLPVGWKPNAEHLRIANELRLGEVGMSFEASRMADWAAKEAKLCVDWDAQFRFWLKTGKPKAFKPHGNDERVSYLKTKTEAKETFFVKVGTPQWDSWVNAGHKRTMKIYRSGDEGWVFGSEWPAEERAISA